MPRKRAAREASPPITGPLVAVPVAVGKYNVLTSDLQESSGPVVTLGVVLPAGMSPETARLAAAELAEIHKLVSRWSCRAEDSWAIAVTGEAVELYVPPAPGDDAGIVLGMGEEETIDLIEGLAQALALLRAERKVAR